MALRDIKYGEELTFDYSCVSESKEEFKKATCLCGSLECRGSFVYYADGESFMQVMKKVNPFVRRTAVLLDAGLNDLTEEDLQFLFNNGIKVAVREWHDVQDSMLSGCPRWLVKWCSYIVRYMKYEEEKLPAELKDLRDAAGNLLYSSPQALQVPSARRHEA